MILAPSAAGTLNAPPLINVPGGAVVIDRTWQTAQPIMLNILLPALAAIVLNRATSGGGALDARIKRANISTSSPLSSGSGTVSKLATEAPLRVFSAGCNGLVMPISLRYASAEKETRLACWFFQPKRPTRVRPGASRTGAWMIAPL